VIRSPMPWVLPGSLQPVVTGADGRFVFRNPARRDPVRASLSGMSMAWGRGARGPDRVLELADYERVGDAKIRLWRQASITGTVLDEVEDQGRSHRAGLSA
jgi:hypothetical protein